MFSLSQKSEKFFRLLGYILIFPYIYIKRKSERRYSKYLKLGRDFVLSRSLIIEKCF